MNCILVHLEEFLRDLEKISRLVTKLEQGFYSSELEQKKNFFFLVKI